jgi:hypothetical protein
VQKRQFAKNNRLTDAPVHQRQTMVAPDLDFADFAKGKFF